MTTTARRPSEHNTSSNEFWSLTGRERDEVWRELRDNEPISWQPPAEGGLMPIEDDDGYWAVVRYADIHEVSTQPEIYCSGEGVQLENIPEMLLEPTQSFLAMDAPRHSSLRRLVSAAFTPRRIATIEGQIKAQAERIVDDLLVTGDCDFVHNVSALLPMWTIYEMVGLPAEQQKEVADAADFIVGSNDPEIQAGRDPLEVINDAMMTLISSGLDLAESRRVNPTDDLMTSLAQAEVDGERLSDEEISAFFVLLSVAGNDTTRNTISHAMKALTDFPEQRAWLMEDFDGRIGTAVDEFIRWASPVMTFKRTVTQDTVLHGQEIATGDKVVMFYPSGNRDERVFDRPWEFDLSRTPNKHQGFGGGGPHFCMGQQLAKSQLRAIFDQLLHRAPDLTVGEPGYLLSNFVHGIKSMPCTVK